MFNILYACPAWSASHERQVSHNTGPRNKEVMRQATIFWSWPKEQKCHTQLDIHTNPRHQHQIKEVDIICVLDLIGGEREQGEFVPHLRRISTDIYKEGFDVKILDKSDWWCDTLIFSSWTTRLISTEYV
jgi:hypothetical protein